MRRLALELALAVVVLVTRLSLKLTRCLCNLSWRLKEATR